MSSITVCIPTMPGRESTLSRLLHSIQGYDLEVLVHERVAPMGDKLNEMFAMAKGEYVVAVDDDDILHPGLIPDYLPPADFVGWKILVVLNGQVAGAVQHRFGQDPDAAWAGSMRGVSPKCLVRTDIARHVAFGNEYTADRAWSREVQVLCGTGFFVDEFVYTYDHWDAAMLGTNPGDNPNAQRRYVGNWTYDRGEFTWLA